MCVYITLFLFSQLSNKVPSSPVTTSRHGVPGMCALYTPTQSLALARVKVREGELSICPELRVFWQLTLSQSNLEIYII